MGRPSPFPPMTAADAASLGFAAFNNCPHQTIDLPDGGFTLTTRSSEGKRTIFYFGVIKKGGPPTFIDVQFHDSGATIPNADCGRSPVLDMLTIGQGARKPMTAVNPQAT